MQTRQPQQKTRPAPSDPSVRTPVRQANHPAPLTRKDLRAQQKTAALEEKQRREDEQYVRVLTGIDRPFLILVLARLAFGVVMGFSASYSYASYKYDDSLYFFKRHLLFAVVGLIAMFLCLYIPIRGIRWLTAPAYIGAIGLLVLVLIPGIGVAEGEAQRWIAIPGVGTFQPSEIAKLAMIMALAWYISRYQEKISDYRRGAGSFRYGVIGCGIIMALIAGLVALEHHISGTLIIAMIAVVMMFMGRVRVRYLLIIGGILAAVAVFLIFVSGYGQTRIAVWLDPWLDPRGKGFQTIQGLYAIGSGGIFGVGLGNSFQKYGFVSQPQNDFIFSIICEELGFIGALAVIGLFLALAWRGYIIARNAPDLYSSLLVFGIVIQVVLQAALNIAVVTNTIPNTGISLPFFSSGGTSLVILMTEMGIVLSVSRYSYQKRS